MRGNSRAGQYDPFGQFVSDIEQTHVRRGSVWFPRDEAGRPEPPPRPEAAASGAPPGLKIDAATVIERLESLVQNSLARMMAPDEQHRDFHAGAAWLAGLFADDLRGIMREAAVDRAQQEESAHGEEGRTQRRRQAGG